MGALRRLLELVSEVVGYSFEDADWDAISYAVSSGGSYYYPLHGRDVVGLELETVNDGSVVVKATGGEETIPWLRVIRHTSDVQVERELRAAFASATRPRHFTNYTHCVECREHDDLLRARTLESLTAADVRMQWSPVPFMTAVAYRYWLPALLRLSLEPQADQFENRLDEITNPYGRQLTYLEPAEREALLAFLRHVRWWRSDLITFEIDPELREAVSRWEARVATADLPC